MSARKRALFSKLQEEKRAKKMREDEDTARLYEDFVEQFMAPENGSQVIQFTQGGVVNENAASPPEQDKLDDVKQTVPPIAIPKGSLPHQINLNPQEKKNKTEETNNTSGTGGVQNEVAAGPPINSAKKTQQPLRKIDQVMQNMMRENEKRKQEQQQKQQQQQQQQQQQSGGGGSRGGGTVTPDTGATNLWVGNLAPEVDESVLKREFGRFGKIVSVKVMWPRDEDQRKRQRNTGFVAFMDREEAEEAKNALNCTVLFDYEMKVDWGKSVPVKYNNLDSIVNSSHDSPGNGEGVQVEMLEDARIRYIIDTMVQYVIEDGSDFEIMVMQKECKNPDFAFLFNVDMPEHRYYRWRIFSLSNRDSLKNWRTNSFIPVSGGQALVPPQMQHASKSATAAQSGGALPPAQRHTPQLPSSERQKFEDMLVCLNGDRVGVCEAMCFALDNSEAVEDVVSVLVDLFNKTDVVSVKKLAILYVVSDILYNSATTAAPNASRFRESFQTVLPGIFKNIQEYLNMENEDTKQFKQSIRGHIGCILHVWQDWRVFPEDFLNNLQSKLAIKEDDKEIFEFDAHKKQPDEKIDIVDESNENSNFTGTEFNQQGVLGLAENNKDRKSRIALLMDLHQQMNEFNQQGDIEMVGQVEPVLQPVPVLTEDDEVTALPANLGPNQEVQKSIRKPTSKWETIDEHPKQQLISKWMQEQENNQEEEEQEYANLAGVGNVAEVDEEKGQVKFYELDKDKCEDNLSDNRESSGKSTREFAVQQNSQKEDNGSKKSDASMNRERKRERDDEDRDRDRDRVRGGSSSFQSSMSKPHYSTDRRQDSARHSARSDERKHKHARQTSVEGQRLRYRHTEGEEEGRREGSRRVRESSGFRESLRHSPRSQKRPVETHRSTHKSSRH